jgi:hypothetical protein
MPANDRRYWPRPEQDHHILGEVKRIKVGRTEVLALMLFESSQGRGNEPAEDLPLRGRPIGSMDAIRCTICGKVHDWIIGQDAMDELLERSEVKHDQDSISA